MRHLLSELVLALRSEQDRHQLGFHGGLMVLLAITDVSILAPMITVPHWTMATLVSVFLLGTFVGIPVWFAHRWRQSLVSPAELQPWLFRERFQGLWSGLLGILLVLLGIRLGAGPAVGVIFAGLVFLSAALHTGWRYARGALPMAREGHAFEALEQDETPLPDATSLPAGVHEDKGEEAISQQAL